MVKIGILFGAGAERYHSLPSGADYTYDTLCTRKDKLYEALKKFYEKRTNDRYVKKHTRAEFLFSHKSHVYRRMIELSVLSALKIEFNNDDYDNANIKKEIVDYCYEINNPYNTYVKHKARREIVTKAFNEYIESYDDKNSHDKLSAKDIQLNEDSINTILKVLYMLALEFDLDDKIIFDSIDKKEFSDQNKDLKSELYYRLLSGVIRKNKESLAFFKPYDDLPEYHKDFITWFVKNNLKYYGVVEKDFSTIINPKEAGNIKFWRLVNYFWSAYFSILIPMLKLSSKYCHLVDDKNQVFDKLLNQAEKDKLLLFEVLHHFSTEDYLKESSINAKRIVSNTAAESYYYSAFKEENIPIDFALTTNYTPFIKTLDLKDNAYCYLAGTVFEFEYPYEMRIINVCNHSNVIKDNDLVFPYILTQAPVKPIIEPKQIKEYSKAINYLDSCELLIILGYSLSENDNHINSLLREYITKPNKKMLVCHYCCSSDTISCQSNKKEEVKKTICQKLRIKDEDYEEQSKKVTVMINNGNAAQLAKSINEYIYVILAE